MSSMIDYIRQLNQESIEMQDDWLQRLQYCCVHQDELPQPEIQLATMKPSPTVNRQSANKPPAAPSAVVANTQSTGPATIDTTFDTTVYTDMTTVADLSISCTTIEAGTATAVSSGIPAGATDTIPNHRVTAAVPPPKTAIPKRTRQTEPTGDQPAMEDLAFDPSHSDAVVAGNLTAHSNAEQSDSETRVATAQPEIADDRPDSNPANRVSRRFTYRNSKKDKTIDSLADTIVDRFPADANATIMFVSLSGSSDTDGTSAKIAQCLANREIGNVMLIDGNLRDRSLTYHLGLADQPGIVDIINRGEPTEHFYQESDCRRLNFLVAGAGELTHRKLATQKALGIISAIKHRYQYSIINGGLIGEPLADLLVGYVDAVYVMIDCDDVDRFDAEDKIAKMRNTGARVLGVVATQR